MDTVKACADGVPGSSVKYQNEDKTFTHATVITTIMGFIDDLYIYVDQTGDNVLISAQSQLRVGKGDGKKNYRNVLSFYKCLNEKLTPKKDVEFKACSKS